MGIKESSALLQAVLSDLRAAADTEPPDHIDPAAIGRIADAVSQAIDALSD